LGFDYDAGEGVEPKRVLLEGLGLSPYEATAYVALLRRGETAPGELTQISGIPRPRTYDVLRSLVAKGLALEHAGRPVRYEALDPRHGVPRLLEKQQENAKKEFSERRFAARGLIAELGNLYDENARTSGIEDRVGVTGGTGAVWELFQAFKEKTKREYVGASVSSEVPPYEIFQREEKMLERGVRLRLIRPFPPSMRKRTVEWYVRLIEKGFEIRSSKEVEFSFDVSDQSKAVVWLNESAERPATKLLWLEHAHLARLLSAHFEQLWENAEPVGGRLAESLV
jgi:sugar-specific transcriptional regulator TrmB